MTSIFLVDDEPEIMELYSAILEPEGFTVIAEASNGLEALEKYDALSQKPDLIILDERMPFKSGLEAARELLARDREARILFVSADPMVKIYARTLGVLGFIEKPFEKQKFVGMVKSVFEPLEMEKPTPTSGVKANGGKSFLFENEEEASSLFQARISAGAAGLCITRQFPENVRSRYGLAGVPCVWLSQIERMDNTIDPSNLGRLVLTISSFMSENQGSVVLLEGLEYLMIQNTFERTMKHIHQINDIVMAAKTTLFVVVNLGSFEESQRAILSSEIEPFKA